jgi:hypothetical protein
MAWLNLLLKGKKVAGAIKSVKPQVKYTGTKSLKRNEASKKMFKSAQGKK